MKTLKFTKTFVTGNLRGISVPVALDYPGWLADQIARNLIAGIPRGDLHADAFTNSVYSVANVTTAEAAS